MLPMSLEEARKGQGGSSSGRGFSGQSAEWATAGEVLRGRDPLEASCRLFGTVPRAPGPGVSRGR